MRRREAEQNNQKHYYSLNISRSFKAGQHWQPLLHYGKLDKRLSQIPPFFLKKNKPTKRAVPPQAGLP